MYWFCIISLVTIFCFRKAFIQLIAEQLCVVWVAKAATKDNCEQIHGMNRALNPSTNVLQKKMICRF